MRRWRTIIAGVPSPLASSPSPIPAHALQARAEYRELLEQNLLQVEQSVMRANGKKKPTKDALAEGSTAGGADDDEGAILKDQLGNEERLELEKRLEGVNKILADQYERARSLAEQSSSPNLGGRSFKDAVKSVIKVRERV